MYTTLRGARSQDLPDAQFARRASKQRRGSMDPLEHGKRLVVRRAAAARGGVRTNLIALRAFCLPTLWRLHREFLRQKAMPNWLDGKFTNLPILNLLVTDCAPLKVVAILAWSKGQLTRLAAQFSSDQARSSRCVVQDRRCLGRG